MQQAASPRSSLCPLTQFASERNWAPAERLSVVAPPAPLPRAPVRLRSRQSRRRLRRSTRSQSGPGPRPAARTPDPDPRTRSGDSACGRRGVCLRASGWGARFSAVATRISRRAVPAGLPDPGLGMKVARGAPGRARRGRAGGVWGLRKAQCRGPSSRAGARQSSRARGARAGAARGAARGRGARGRQAALITWPAWFSPSPGGRAGGRGVS